MLARLAPVALLAAALIACSAGTEGEEEESDVGLGEAAVTSIDTNQNPQVAITEPEALRQLQASGFGIGHHFGVSDDAHADKLETSPAYAAISHGIAANLEALKQADDSLDVGMRFGHRLFDKKWLR